MVSVEYSVRSDPTLLIFFSAFCSQPSPIAMTLRRRDHGLSDLQPDQASQAFRTTHCFHMLRAQPEHSSFKLQGVMQLATPTTYARATACCCLHDLSRLPLDPSRTGRRKVSPNLREDCCSGSGLRGEPGVSGCGSPVAGAVTQQRRGLPLRISSARLTLLTDLLMMSALIELRSLPMMVSSCPVQYSTAQLRDAHAGTRLSVSLSLSRVCTLKSHGEIRVVRQTLGPG